MSDTTSFAVKVAEALKASDLTFAEQVACFASVETVLRFWDSALQNEIEVRYGSVAMDVLKQALKEHRDFVTHLPTHKPTDAPGDYN